MLEAANSLGEAPRIGLWQRDEQHAYRENWASQLLCPKPHIVKLYQPFLAFDYGFLARCPWPDRVRDVPKLPEQIIQC